MRFRRTSKSGTIQFVSTAREASNLYLPAFEFSLANGADTHIIERIPFPDSISRAQNRQPIVEFDVSDHNWKRFCSLRRNKQSGHWMIE
jgi:hypothetical protein